MIRNILLTTLFGGLVSAAAVTKRAQVWQPDLTTRWQIILSSNINANSGLSPSSAKIWDLDLFNTDASVISSLHDQGVKVICYFSAGTSEEGRPDLGSLGSSDYGKGLPDWPGEKYIDIRSNTVWNVMQSRISLAAQKGCDAVDPDNMGRVFST
jgi:hypothetical protein